MTRKRKRSPSRPPTGRTKKVAQPRKVTESEGPGLLEAVGKVGKFVDGAIRVVDGVKTLANKLGLS